MTSQRDEDPVSDAECPVRDVLDRVGDQWSMLVLGELGEKTLRFNELGRRIDDISRQMLSRTLRRLEYDGLVRRTVYAQVPPRVEYELTDLGHSLMEPIGMLVDWAERNHGAIRAARRNAGRVDGPRQAP